MPLHFSPRHLSAARSCSRVIANPAQKWGCRKNTLFLAWIFCGVGFNSAADKTPPVKTLVFQTPHAPCLKPSRFCYIMRPPVCTMAPSVRLCPELYFSDKKGKKKSLVGNRTTDHCHRRSPRCHYCEWQCFLYFRRMIIDDFILY